jgi:hypothetical protein
MISWMKKQDTTISCFQKTHLTDKTKHWLKVKVWKKIFQENEPKNSWK